MINSFIELYYKSNENRVVNESYIANNYSSRCKLKLAMQIEDTDIDKT